MLWTAEEDKLLHAIVHEFGGNWALVADVMGSSTALQGIARSRTACKDRYKEIQVRPAALLCFSPPARAFRPVHQDTCPRLKPAAKCDAV